MFILSGLWVTCPILSNIQRPERTFSDDCAEAVKIVPGLYFRSAGGAFCAECAALFFCNLLISCSLGRPDSRRSKVSPAVTRRTPVGLDAKRNAHTDQQDDERVQGASSHHRHARNRATPISLARGGQEPPAIPTVPVTLRL
jgi:hypothetical protein